MSWWNPLEGIVDAVSTAYGKHKEAKAKVVEAKINRDVAKYEAEAKRYEKLIEVEADWDKEALRQSQFSWKDEFLTIIFFAPFVAAFIPPLQEYVQLGFKILGTLPEWYIICILGIVAASFGLRWWFTQKKL